MANVAYSGKLKFKCLKTFLIYFSKINVANVFWYGIGIYFPLSV